MSKGEGAVREWPRGHKKQQNVKETEEHGGGSHTPDIYDEGANKL